MPEVVTTVGWHAHQMGVRRLIDSFADIPAGQRVRLAKRTSNLFRSRTAAAGPGLDTSGLTGVIAVDPVARTADVQGMCTYEHLVDATLAHGLLPYVVPELKTITLGGAVTGMGVESSAFRLGLPHESVVEMDILTGTGDIVTCSREHNTALFRTFPNSYGSLGYAVRLRIRLERVPDFVALRHVRFHDLHELADALTNVADTGSWDDVEVHYLDGVVFSPTESYLVLGTQTGEPGPVSDYTGDRTYYQSLRHPDGILRDRLTIRDYIWRWDTDWFWCSRAFGAQNPTLRRIWPKAWKRSSFYWKLVGLDKRYNIADRIEAHYHRPARERVVQDIEVTAARLPDFLEWFLPASGIEPVWLCPIRLRSDSSDLVGRGQVPGEPTDGKSGAGAAAHPWPLYPLTVGQTWVNVGFWSSVPVDLVDPDTPGAFNRLIEEKVAELGGHKSLYSEAFYSPEQFRQLYGGDIPEQMKQIYDPDGRFPGLYQKTVEGR